MADVILEEVTKRFGDVVAVKNVNIKIKDKEFVVLVGPSGSGKSTILRMVAGLEELTSGNIYIGDKLVNNFPPKDRDVAMVFQSYALYPHMNVWDNMSFSLRLKKFPKSVIEQRVKEAAELLEIEPLLDRKPKQLSGGQRQRVALGRAIVRKPKVFLLDEPLSNLDAKLRVYMRAELKKLHRRLDATIIYVTHDQVEAMTMADRIAVLNEGVLQQVDTPNRLYTHPENEFVAGFIGSMNFIDCTLKDDNDIYLDAGEFMIKIPFEQYEFVKDYLGKDVIMGIRPEDIAMQFSGLNTLKTMVEDVEPMGSETFIHLKVGDIHLFARANPDTKVKLGQNLEVGLNTQKIHIFDKDTTSAIV
ncbi:MAG: ABC transporter ATP-binding protein [Methanosarcinales archaeon]